MNILLEQLTLHIGAMKHLADVTRAHARLMTPTELLQAERLMDESGWVYEEIIEALSQAVEASTIPELPAQPAIAS